MYRSTSGVPQGSTLVPLLFYFFISDVSAAIKKSSFFLCVGSINIFRRIESIDDCLDLEQDISSFSKWCSDHRLSLHPGETKVPSQPKNEPHFSYATVLITVSCLELTRPKSSDCSLTVPQLSRLMSLNLLGGRSARLMLYAGFHETCGLLIHS